MTGSTIFVPVFVFGLLGFLSGGSASPDSFNLSIGRRLFGDDSNGSDAIEPIFDSSTEVVRVQSTGPLLNPLAGRLRDRQRGRAVLLRGALPPAAAQLL